MKNHVVDQTNILEKWPSNEGSCIIWDDEDRFARNIGRGFGRIVAQMADQAARAFRICAKRATWAGKRYRPSCCVRT